MVYRTRSCELLISWMTADGAHHRMIGQVHLLDKLLGLVQHLLRVAQGEEVGDDIVPAVIAMLWIKSAMGDIIDRSRRGEAHPSLRNLATASLSRIGIVVD